MTYEQGHSINGDLKTTQTLLGSPNLNPSTVLKFVTPANARMNDTHGLLERATSMPQAFLYHLQYTKSSFEVGPSHDRITFSPRGQRGE